MTRKPNHKCKYCGKEYYACRSCDESPSGHWKSVACSFDHYVLYTDIVMKERGEILSSEDCVELYKPDLIENDVISETKDLDPVSDNIFEDKPKAQTKKKSKKESDN